jgi:hypothetical protein
VSVSLFEKSPILEALGTIKPQEIMDVTSNQLNLFY